MSIMNSILSFFKKEKSDFSKGQIKLKESTRILRFEHGSEQKFDDQLKFLKAAIDDQQYPRLEIIAMKKVYPTASFEHLIIETGAKEEYLREMNKEVRKDIFSKVHPGRELSDIWADNVVMDTPRRGFLLTGTEPFEETVREISKGCYSITEVLHGQSDKLDAMEKKAKSDLKRMFPNGVKCECGKIHAVEELKEFSCGPDFIVFRCPGPYGQKQMRSVE